MLWVLNRAMGWEVWVGGAKNRQKNRQEPFLGYQIGLQANIYLREQLLN